SQAIRSLSPVSTSASITGGRKIFSRMRGYRPICMNKAECVGPAVPLPRFMPVTTAIRRSLHSWTSRPHYHTGSIGRGTMRNLLIILLVYLLSFSYLYLRCRDRLPFAKYLSNHALLLSPLNFVFTFF